eukprot:COSAG02_NODE_8344_length_2604_cov_25.631521_5_plen_41_part_01
MSAAHERRIASGTTSRQPTYIDILSGFAARKLTATMKHCA